MAVPGGAAGRHAYEKIFASLGGCNQKWARTAPVLILGTAKTNSARTARRTGLRCTTWARRLVSDLQAAALGLATHQMAGFDPEAAQKAFGIPEEYALGTVIALGYQGEPAALGDETLIEREIAARASKPLGEICVQGVGRAGEDCKGSESSWQEIEVPECPERAWGHGRVRELGAAAMVNPSMETIPLNPRKTRENAQGRGRLGRARPIAAARAAGLAGARNCGVRGAGPGAGGVGGAGAGTGAEVEYGAEPV